MNPTKKYLQGRDRETADTVTGKLIERMPDGTYLYEAVDSGARRYATPRGTDEFAIGSRVRIDRVSASRGTIGSQDTIVSSAPREQRGLSGTTPVIDRVGVGRTAVISVDPDPLVIVAGGDPGAQVFTGIGFDSQPATYVTMYEGGPDPDVANDDDPVASDTEVTMSILADVTSPLGEFDAIVNGYRVSKALRILPPAEEPPLEPLLPRVFAMRYDGALVVYDPGTDAILDTYTDYTAFTPAALGVAGTNVLAMYRSDGASAPVLVLDGLTGARGTDLDLVALVPTGEPRLSAAQVGAELWVPFASPVSGCDVLRIGGTIETFNVAGSFGAAPAMVAGDEAVFIYGESVLARVDPVTHAITHTAGVSIDYWSSQLTLTDDAVWIYGFPDAFAKYDRADLSLLIPDVATDHHAWALLRFAGGKLFLVYQDAFGVAAVAYVNVIDQSTGAITLVASIDGDVTYPGFSVGTINSDAEFLYVLDDYRGRVAKVSIVDYTFTLSDVDPGAVGFGNALVTPVAGSGAFNY